MDSAINQITTTVLFSHITILERESQYLLTKQVLNFIFDIIGHNLAKCQAIIYSRRLIGVCYCHLIYELEFQIARKTRIW